MTTNNWDDSTVQNRHVFLDNPLSSVETSSAQSLSDIGYESYQRIVASLDERELTSHSFTPEELLLLQKKTINAPPNIPIDVQMELALLWRTLGILRYSVGIPGVLQSFYEDLLCVIEGVDSLSLSNFNDYRHSSYNYSDQDSNLKGENCGYIASENKTIVAPTQSLLSSSSFKYESSSTEKTKDSHFLFSVPELAYLKEGSDYPVDETNDCLGVVQKLFNSAENFALSLPSVERNIMYSVCLALAVKSGRLSLLLQTACLLSSVDDENKTEFSLSSLIVLKDITDFIITSTSKLEIRKTSTKKMEFQQLSHLQRRSKALRQISEYSPFISIDPFENLSKGKCNHFANRVTLSFGKADHGKLGLGDSQLHRLVPTIIDSLKDVNITKISSMGTTTIGIDLEGSAYMWGVGGSAGSNSQASSTYGYGLHDHQINTYPRRIESLPLHSIVVDISCGLGHVLFLLKTG